jgi:hypothetical protein
VPSNSVVAGVPAKVICSVDTYYENSIKKGVIYETLGMTRQEKRKYFEDLNSKKQ